MSDLDRAVPELYQELRRLAASALRRERRSHTLQPTALVNEAYLRLARSPGLRLTDRRQFLAIAARVMRQVLVDSARARRRAKRGKAPLQVTLDSELASDASTPFDLLALDDALNRLQALGEPLVRVVELRYFAGLTVEETAEVLGVSPTTVKRDAALARSWLVRELSGGAGGPGGPAGSRGPGSAGGS